MERRATARRTEETASPDAERLRPLSLGLLGFQHVLVMYAGAVAVPLIVGRALKLSPEEIALLVNADLFACGIAIPLVAPAFFEQMPHALHPLLESGILLATIAAVLLNLFFNGLGSAAQARDAALHQARTADAH